MADNIFDNSDLLLRYYQTQAEELQWRFQAIWEAMRHYTWLLSILLAGWPVVAFANKDLNTIKTSLHYLVIAPALGLFFSIIGYFVISKAYDFYNVLEARLLGTAPLTGERAQATLRGRPRGRLGTVGLGKGRVRGRPRRLGSTQGAGATL